MPEVARDVCIYDDDLLGLAVKPDSWARSNASSAACATVQVRDLAISPRLIRAEARYARGGAWQISTAATALGNIP